MRAGPLVGLSVIAGLLLAFGSHALQPERLILQGPATQVAPLGTPQTVFRTTVVGRLIDVSGPTLTVADALGSHRIEVDQATDITRGAGYTLVTNHDASRLRTGDSLWVAGTVADGGTVQAGNITANSFIGRDGIIVRHGDDSIDVRLRTARLSNEFNDVPERFRLDPAVHIQSPQGSSSDALTPGRGVAIQGFIADDGSFIALYLWPYDP